MASEVFVIGSGPNGLAAAIHLARAGFDVTVYEKESTVGGGTRTQELTLPGFKHDVCSAIHPMGKGSPFFKTLPLESFGLEWIEPEIPVAHPFDTYPAAALYHSFKHTIAHLGEDGKNYRKLISPFLKKWDLLTEQFLAPFTLKQRHPLLMARFGWQALKSAERFVKQFTTPRARALFGGLAGHGLMPFDKAATSAIGLVLGINAHTVGWPYPKGGSQGLTDAMAAYFTSLGGNIEFDAHIKTLDQLPEAKVILFNNTPRQILNIAGKRIPQKYAEKLHHFQYGCGVFKMDFALSEPIPWSDNLCRKAGTVHLGGMFEEIAASEQQSGNGQHPEKPYVLVAQQSLFDDTRAPEGKHTAWAYCHVPNGSQRDMSQPILEQMERFAPGFRDCVIDTHTMNSKAMEAYNPNYIGGDINGGKPDISQLFTRPVKLFDPYHIPDTNMYICSSSTPPGGGVHGMCGYHAAESVLRNIEVIDTSWME